jgi:hypothetical protein
MNEHPKKPSWVMFNLQSKDDGLPAARRQLVRRRRLFRLLAVRGSSFYGPPNCLRDWALGCGEKEARPTRANCASWIPRILSLVYRSANVMTGSVVLVITFRQDGNTTEGRPHTVVSKAGDLTAKQYAHVRGRHLCESPLRGRCQETAYSYADRSDGTPRFWGTLRKQNPETVEQRCRANAPRSPSHQPSRISVGVTRERSFGLMRSRVDRRAHRPPSAATSRVPETSCSARSRQR